MKLILGNGIAAKIFAFYNPEYRIIGREEKHSSAFQSFVFLQDNEYNHKLIRDLSLRVGKIPTVLKNFDVVAFSDGAFKNDLSPDEKLSIINKKLTAADGEKLSYQSKVFESSIKLSEEKNSILKVIDINFGDLNELLSQAVKPQVLEEAFVTGINPKQNLVQTENGKVYHYSECISTIPANIFYKLIGSEAKNLKTLSTTIVEGTEEELGVPEIPYENAIVYYPELKYEFSKIIKQDNVCFAEVTGKSKVFNGTEVPNTRIIRQPLVNVSDIYFLGRYAEWNPNIRMQDIVRRSSEKTIMQRIWCDQRQLSSKFFDFTEDINTIQRNVKDISLLMMDEVFSLLNKINWKVHQKEKKLDINEIKEEWIDIFKYWLTIGINLGISFEDFADAYQKKKIKLEQRYGK